MTIQCLNCNNYDISKFKYNIRIYDFENDIITIRYSCICGWEFDENFEMIQKYYIDKSIFEINELDIGKKVIYKEGEYNEEKGVITSYNNEYIFVKYGNDIQSKSTRIKDLTWDD